MDLLQTIGKDILSKDDKKDIKQHLLAMKCDPGQINGFIWFLDRTELFQMKYATLPLYKGGLKEGVYRINAKKKAKWILAKDDVKRLLKNIEKIITCLDDFHMNDEFSLFPVYRNFYESAQFVNLCGEATDKIKTVYPLLTDLQRNLKESIKLATYRERGRTPKEYGTDFSYHIIHLFYIYFNKLPSATTKNSYFQQIVAICYRSLGIEAADLRKTISKAVTRYRKTLNQ